MWKCQNCETLNEGDFCIICGKKYENKTPSKPTPSAELAKKTELVIISREKPETYNKRKPESSLVMMGGIFAALIISVVIFFIMVNIKYISCKKLISSGHYAEASEELGGIKYYSDAKDLLDECNYQNAKQLLDNNEVETARKIFKGLAGYKDSGQFISECDYQSAKNLLDNNKEEDAKKIFEKLAGYKDSEQLINACDYKSAIWYMSQGELIAAYYKLINIENYEDSALQLSNLKQLIYNKGVELYENDSYSDARAYFKKSVCCGREDDYIRLIAAHTTIISDISTLYDLIGFEDTAELLLSDTYIVDFLFGQWIDYSGNYIEYYKDGHGDSTRCSYNLPTTDGEYYKLEKGIHYKGSDETGWVKQWSYTIVGANKIKVYCYKDNQTYTLHRKK